MSILRRKALPLLASILLLAGCSLPRGAALQSEVLSQQNRAEPDFQVVQVSRDTVAQLAEWPVTGWSGEYRWFARDRAPDSNLIQTGDRITMVVWESQENSLLNGIESKATDLPPMSVSSSGEVFVPYVGSVAIRGMGKEEARQKLQARIEEISPSAQVQLSVEPGRNNSVDVVSGVGAPGRYPLESRDTRILSVIAQAGGINEALRNPLVRLQRNGKGYDILADELLESPARNVRVRGGDQISVVEDDRSFNVLGAAGSQQVMYFEDEHMSAMQALSAMGGLQASRADPKGILVLRDYDAGALKPGMAGPDMRQVVFTFDLTTAGGLFAARQFQINPGDTLLATESPVAKARTILGLLGTVVGVSNSANDL